MAKKKKKQQQMKQQNKETSINHFQEKAIGRWNLGMVLTTCYGIFLFTVFLGYTWNGYVNILEAKTACFAVTTSLYILLGCVFLIYSYLRGRKVFDFKNPFYCFLGLFLFSSFISTMICGDTSRAMKAVGGKRFGFIILFLCIVSCFIVYETFSWNIVLMIGLFAGSGLFAILTILNRFGYDPLGFYLFIRPHQIKGFLATFGQMNLVSEFLCISLAIWASLYFIRKDKFEYLYLFGTFLATLAGLATASEGFFLGIFGTLLILFFFALEDQKSILQYARLCSVMYVALLVLSGLNRIWKSTFAWDPIHQFLLSVQGGILCFILLGIVWGIYGILMKKNPNLQTRKRIRNGITIVFLAIVLILVLLMTLCTKGTLSISENVDKYLIFGDSWGTNRGFVWTRTVRQFFKMPIGKIFFGCGLGGFQEFFAPFYEESIQLLGYYFVDAHNVFLQFLVTLGILGCLSFYGLVIYTIVQSIRDYKEDKQSLIKVVVLLVWILQSMINNPLVMNMPFVFYFLAWGKRKK